MATGHFSGKFFSKIAGSGPDGSNDTILEFVSCPGAEPIECQTHTHTEYGYYNIGNALIVPQMTYECCLWGLTYAQ